MKQKRLLYIGILLLTVGILLKVFTSIPYVPLALILTGVFFKGYYVYKCIKSGTYKPGFEMVLLVIGILSYLTGNHLSHQTTHFYPLLLKITGMCLKAGFVVIFIIKSRKRTV